MLTGCSRPEWGLQDVLLGQHGLRAAVDRVLLECSPVLQHLPPWRLCIQDRLCSDIDVAIEGYRTRAEHYELLRAVFR